MKLEETYNKWLKDKVGEINPSTRYEVQVSTKDASGVKIEIDLVWYILLHIKEKDQIRLDVALALLQDKGYQQQFKNTQNSENCKAIIAEFLILNYLFIVGLKGYIDFNVLNVPVDFISHALLINFSDELDIPAVQQMRFMIAELALDSGFTLNSQKGDTEQTSPETILKVLSMENINQRFNLLQRLLTVGFPLFGADPLSNNHVAVLLIDNRNNPICLKIIKQYSGQFAELKFHVAGDKKDSNLADYYYWAKEDMASLSFIRDALGLDISS